MTAKRFVVVVNPRGGTRRGLAIWDRVRPVLEEAGLQLELRVTGHPGHAREIAAALTPDQCDGACVIGGDGTIHEVVNGVMDQGQPAPVPLGFVPAGSGNTMHQHLGCTDPIEAARRIAAGRTRPLDVVRVTTEGRTVHCVNIVGWGGVADINGLAEKLRFLGPPRYAAAALWHIVCARRRPARLILDGREVEDEFLFVIGCNTKYTGKGMKLAPRAEIDDGKLDVVAVRRASRLEMLSLFKRVFDGSHTSLRCVEYYQVRSFAIESAGRETLDLDGENHGSSPVSVQMIPGRLQVFG